jgi:protein tyrosine phosphatase (PTP) superfamily phosphohydrolase (DUF442 family)
LGCTTAEQIRRKPGAGLQDAGYRGIVYLPSHLGDRRPDVAYDREWITGLPLAFDRIPSAAGRVAMEQLTAIADHIDVVVTLRPVDRAKCNASYASFE